MFAGMYVLVQSCIRVHLCAVHVDFVYSSDATCCKDVVSASYARRESLHRTALATPEGTGNGQQCE